MRVCKLLRSHSDRDCARSDAAASVVEGAVRASISNNFTSIPLHGKEEGEEEQDDRGMKETRKADGRG